MGLIAAAAFDPLHADACRVPCPARFFATRCFAKEEARHAGTANSGSETAEESIGGVYFVWVQDPSLMCNE